jgi:multiple sugar transport system ATP-binding protein
MYLESLSEWTIDAHVEVTELMGSCIYLYVVAEEQNLIANVNAHSTSAVDTDIKIAIDVNRLHIFDKDTEKCVIH